MRSVLTILGALLGLSMGPADGRLFGLLIGALAGFAIADLADLRAQIGALGRQIAQLRSDIAELRARASAAASAPAAPVDSAARATAPLDSPDVAAAPAFVSPSAAVPSAAASAPRAGAPPSAAATPTAPPPAAPSRAAPSRAAPPPGAPPPRRPAPGRGPALDPSDEVGARIARAIRQFFTGGNTLVRVGIIVLLFGVGFLLRYLAEHTDIPIELRISAIAAGAIALLLFGWRLRESRRGYALAIQGGAVGILYLTVFAALRLYHLVPVPLAFALLAALAVTSAALAVLQNSQSFALLGVTGGFLAPVLASTGQGSHVVLFSYYAVLNAGILAVAWFRAWRPLNLAGFVFTFAIGTAWGVLQYHPQEFATTEPFLVLFFLFYVALSVLFSERQPADLRGYVDGTLVFGTPLIAFGLQAALLRGRLLALAYCALAVSGLYLGIAWLLKRRRNASQTVLIDAFAALGVVFLTLAIPLALEVRWNIVTWGIEGAALIWIGCRQHRLLARLFGALLIFAAGCLIASEFNVSGALTLPLERYYGVLALSAACIFAARTLFAFRDQLAASEHWLAGAVFLWGLAWWTLGGVAQVSHYLPLYIGAGALAFLAITALACSELYRLIGSSIVKFAALALLPVLVCFAFAAALSQSHPFADGGFLAWPFAFAVWYGIMHRHEGPAHAGVANTLNAVSAWLLCAVSSWEASWGASRIIQGSEEWPAIAWAAIPGAVLYALPRLATRLAWPFGKHRELYLFTVGTGLAIYLAIWSLTANFALDASALPLPYLPLMNPLDIAELGVLLVLTRHWRFLRRVRSAGIERLDERIPLPALVALAFIWQNAVLLRTLHHWYGIPLELGVLIDSTLVETSLSIFWAVLALATMLIAARKRSRIAWLAGAALMTAVIVKLFFVDLSRIGSIERIVSFVGVGLLMLVVGYFSPLPPSIEERHP